ncbi:MAG: hypothetical protein MJZ37_06995 [Bacilli bacterium]|nr:hypothetical protein [Bacilli bacterium]
MFGSDSLFNYVPEVNEIYFGDIPYIEIIASIHWNKLTENFTIRDFNTGFWL